VVVGEVWTAGTGDGSGENRPSEGERCTYKRKHPSQQTPPVVKKSKTRTDSELQDPVSLEPSRRERPVVPREQGTRGHDDQERESADDCVCEDHPLSRCLLERTGRCPVASAPAGERGIFQFGSSKVRLGQVEEKQAE
jgi:hypothetical protein